MNGNQKPVNSISNLPKQPDSQFALQATGLGTWEFDPSTKQILWDDRCRALFGLAKDKILPYEEAIQYIHPDDAERVRQALERALAGEADGTYDQTYRTTGADDGLLRWVRFWGRAYFTHAGELHRFAGVAQDVTQQVQTQPSLEESRFKTLVAATPTATAVFVGRDMLIQQVNEPMLAIWGKDKSVIGKTARELMPELEGQSVLDQLQHVFDTGQPVRLPEAVAYLGTSAQPKVAYVDQAYYPFYDQNGRVRGVVNTAIDVTSQVIAREALADSEARFSNIIQQSPAAMMVLRGEEFIIDQINTSMLSFIGRGEEVIGQPLIAVIPELEGQYAWQQAQRVYREGISFDQNAILVPHKRTSVVQEYYYDVSYRPLREGGTITGMIQVVTDVTSHVQGRKALEESNNSLQNAIQVGELGTFSVDIASNQLTCSARVAEWFGFDSLVADTESFIGGVGETEQDYVRDELQNTILAGPQGRYDVTHSIVNAKTGRRTLIHALGRVYFDESGLPLKVEGIALDITAQRESQQQLEAQVQQRTQELTLANQDLQRSNENLQQFAYVASHDLQEPLRKVQAFSTLLKEYMGSQLDETAIDYLERITKAGARMSTLIRDLLSYSRIATRQQAFGPISLDAVIAGVLDTLSLEIEQRQAQIEVDELPIVNGDGLQLSQLFQNLLGNALKFTPASERPQVRVDYFYRQLADLPAEVRANRSGPFYHQISVSDKGVGFDTKYLDRIFQVFQRLHSKSEFPGTGVGLAICQRVLENHGGAITANSTPGQGATFCVYLPA